MTFDPHIIHYVKHSLDIRTFPFLPYSSAQDIMELQLLILDSYAGDSSLDELSDVSIGEDSY